MASGGVRGDRSSSSSTRAGPRLTRGDRRHSVPLRLPSRPLRGGTTGFAIRDFGCECTSCL
eukprot:4908614-Lingulodinium_polyedra.AAC.1